MTIGYEVKRLADAAERTANALETIAKRVDDQTLIARIAHEEFHGADVEGPSWSERWATISATIEERWETEDHRVNGTSPEHLAHLIVSALGEQKGG